MLLLWPGILLLANLLVAYMAWAIYAIHPQGRWDESTLTGIEAGSAMALALAVLVLLLTLIPVRRGRLRRWWYAPPLAFAGLAIARWTYIVQTYPRPGQ
ncbi:hypothetical protein [Streptomyces sp. NPDC047315]|uniref:hypothetical protein n=1 Tax=Streptomyces sp. NPDC047315 TaxID=3155142 RepID=UPI0033C22BFA